MEKNDDIIIVRIPKKMKSELDAKAKSIPMNFSTLVRIYLKRGLENS